MAIRSSSSSSDARGRKVEYCTGNNEWISKLSDDLLHNILSRLSTEEAVKTSVLSPRWVDLWKWRPHLVLDMRKVLERTRTKNLHKVYVRLAGSMTKTLKNHRGNLESCIIHHYVSQCKDGTLESWIHTVTRVKHTKDLTLVNHNYHGCNGRYKVDNLLYLRPDTFSDRSLTSLSLYGISLVSLLAFRDCWNLKTLKLLNIVISKASVLSRVFATCSSLEVIVLQINCLARYNVLKIENNNLKFLQVTYTKIDKIEVYATCLDVLDINFIKCEKENFILAAPNIRFNRGYWACYPHPHISYNVSSLAQEKKNIWHELMVSDFCHMTRHGSLSVSVELTNPKEVEILKEVLLMWDTNEMIELEILFKNNNASREEGECSTNGRAHKKLWEDAKPFPNADFRVFTVWMYNFDGSNKEEFALASHFVMQKTVTKKMMIETSSFPPTKKLKVEAAVAKLMELPKGNKGLSIECF